MNQTRKNARLAVGREELAVAIAGTTLVPTADGSACSCSTSCSARRKV